MPNLFTFLLFFLALSNNCLGFSRAYSEYTPPVQLDSLSEIKPDLFQERLSLKPAFNIIAKRWHKDRKLESGSISFLPLQLSKIPKDLNRENPWGVYGISTKSWEFLFWRMIPPEKEWLCALFEEALNVPRPCNLDQIGFKIYTKNSKYVPQTLQSYMVSQRNGGINILLTFEKEEKWPDYLKNLYREKKFIVVPDPKTLIDLTLSNSKILNNEMLAKEINEFKDIYVLANPKAKPRFTKKNESKKDPILDVFDFEPEYIDLYSKPLARNSFIYGTDGLFKDYIFLEGPKASKYFIKEVEELLFTEFSDEEIGIQQYYLPMHYKGTAIFLHKPILSWQKNSHVYVAEKPKGLLEFRSFPTRWERESSAYTYLSAQMYHIQQHFKNKQEGYEAALNYKKIIEFLENEKDLSKDLSYALINPQRSSISNFDEWKKTLPKAVWNDLSGISSKKETIRSITFQRTIGNEFERKYWDHIYTLSEGLFDQTTQKNKNNADCAEIDNKGQMDPHCNSNSLSVLADYLKNYYEDLEIPVYFHEFKWETDFNFGWQGLGETQRNVIAVIHGKDNHPHDEVIILADHYDTAYEGDTYEKQPGHRHAAQGADDNYSATATLMLAAKYLKTLPLKKDIWLVHLTGEEFPADCLGARMLVQDYLNKTNILYNKRNPKIAGVYIMDMIAHHRMRDLKPEDTSPAIFQISPGRGAQSQELAKTAFAVTQNWNDTVSARSINRRFSRRNPWKRTGKLKVELPKFLSLEPEIRPYWHFHSSVFNTDAQIFSDARIPVVLFMENYDIDRKGYHDTLDTVENIDLDYGRAISAIAIESAAQMATR